MGLDYLCPFIGAAIQGRNCREVNLTPLLALWLLSQQVEATLAHGLGKIATATAPVAATSIRVVRIWFWRKTGFDRPDYFSHPH
jgi:hypothetical protein